jgi:hypothetical protein
MNTYSFRQQLLYNLEMTFKSVFTVVVSFTFTCALVSETNDKNFNAYCSLRRRKLILPLYIVQYLSHTENINIIGKTAIFEPQPSLEDSASFVSSIRPSGFHFFGFRNNIFFLQRFASNRQSGRPCLCIYVPQWQDGHVILRVLFSSPSTTRRTTVEVF